MATVFHIARSDEWSAARTDGEYRVSTLGQALDEVGFIHCSHLHQVERVTNAAYRGAGPLVLLSIDPDLVPAEIREESGGGPETFPHRYGPLPITDYAMMTVDESWSMPCHCQTPPCRGIVTGADWRRADLHELYRGHFSPFIERRLSGSIPGHR